MTWNRIAAALKCATMMAVAVAISWVLASTAAAATITTWGMPIAINSNADILNPSNVVHAVNFGNEVDPINVDVGGINVEFDPTGVVGGTGFKNDSFFVDDNPDAGVVLGDTDSEFHRVLDSFRDNSNSSYTFTGLTGGETYDLQVFHSDDRGNRAVVWNVDGTEISFTDGVDTFRSAYVVASVTLGPEDTSFVLTRTTGQINAAVLTTSQIPEPSSIALSLLGLLGLAGVAVRRKRRAA